MDPYIDRRGFLRRALLLGISTPVLSGLLAACAAPAPTAAPAATTGPASAPPNPTTAPAAPATSAAAAAATPTAQPNRGGILRVTTNPAVNIDPHRLTSGGGTIVVRPSVNYLVRVDEGGNLAPDLATSWTPSDNVATWTFKLRQGVKFHNGAPLTAADVVATYQRLVDKTTGST